MKRIHDDRISAGVVQTYAQWAMVLLVVSCGCQDQLQTGYGRASGPNYSGSVNGTIIFHEMIESTGRSVDRYSKFSPRWEKYQTIYWIPDSFKPPQQELVDKIEQWLAADRYRTLVFVTRDFDAAMSYWDKLRQSPVDAEQTEDFNRQFFDAATQYLSWKRFDETEKCDWYQVVGHPYTKATEFSGVLTDHIETEELDLRFSGLPAPGDVQEFGQFGEYDVDVLMTVDSYPYIYSLHRDKFPDSRILVVGNASFLLNFPLVNLANRQLAAALIECAGEFEAGQADVLFIESEYDLPISDRDAPETQSQWFWITRKPLRYIVPNLLFCCLLFCFVYFPIFGRPKRIRKKSTTNFQDHINALAQLIRKTKSVEAPRSWIEGYRRRTTHSEPGRNVNIVNKQDSTK